MMMENKDIMAEIKRETEHIVAILDLLGASEIITGKNGESEVALNQIFYIFDKAETTWPRLGKSPSVLQNIKCVTFSDNIAIGLDISEAENREEIIRSFVKYVSIFQSAALKNNFLFRGGIAIGQLYMNSQKNFIWGKALVDAHILEEKTAIYPRVVLSHQFDEYVMLKNTQVLQDFDGMYFVDYVSTVSKLYPEWVAQIKSFIKEQVVKYKEKERILQKYGWLQHYVEQCEQNRTEIQSVEH